MNKESKALYVISAYDLVNQNPLVHAHTKYVFGFYNIYNRKNAASISFTQNQETYRNEAIKTSIFGLVPSITYNFKI